MDSELQQRSISSGSEYKIRCYVDKLDTMIEVAKRLLKETTWKKTRLAAIDRQICDTTKLITEGLQNARDMQARKKDEEELIAHLSRSTSQLNQEKTSLLASVNGAPANGKSQATSLLSMRKRKPCQLNFNEIASMKARMDNIDKELVDIGKQLTKTRHFARITEAKVIFEQDTVASHTRLVDELRPKKAKLTAFMNEIDDKLHQIEAISPIGQHYNAADSARYETAQTFEDPNDNEFKIRCYISKLETRAETAKHVLNDVIWIKARLAAIDRDIFDTSRQITQLLMYLRQLQLKVNAEQELFDNLNRLASQLKLQKTALPANDESQATASSRTKNESRQSDLDDEILRKNTRIDVIDNELSEIYKEMSDMRQTTQLAEAKIRKEQYTIADRRKCLDELKRQKTELLAFLSELDDIMQPLEAITTSMAAAAAAAVPPSVNS